MINAKVKKEIDKWIKKYPPEQKQSAVMIALRLVQAQNNGWLTTELMDAVADYLEMPKISVYEVATFYSMYSLKPIGKHRLHVCTNIACKLKGAGKIIEYLERRLKIKAGETTPDGQYTLVPEIECLAACGGAPMMQVDFRDYHEDLTPDKVDQILDDLDKKVEVDE